MSRTRELAGGGRGVELEPERLARFLQRFADGHGGAQRTAAAPERVEITTADGSIARIPVPFAPLPAPPGLHEGLQLNGLLEHLSAPRTVGLVLVRLGRFSVGVARDGRVLDSSTGSRPVHGRNAAGGQSQRRFARRREGQARAALRAAADTTARVLLCRADELDGVVLGGDHAALGTLAEDQRLAGLLARAEPGVLNVPEPRRRVFDEAARRARNVEVRLF